MTKDNYICPVCGFDKLNEPPFDRKGLPSYEVCPCCGFEFGFDGIANRSAFIAFRRRWIESGAKWFMPGSRPKGWDMKKQLANLNKK